MPINALLVQYDGTSFYGFQRQKQLPSIQAHLEDSIYTALKERVKITAAGRTDTGVHSIGMIVSFVSHNKIANFYKFLASLNALTPAGISIQGGCEMDERFNARFSCTEREYEYWIFNSKYPNPLLEKRALWLHKTLNFKVIESELNSLVGKYDFRSFAKASSVKEKITERQITEVRIYNSSDWSQLVKVRIRGTGFLHNMIRILLGSVYLIATGKTAVSLREMMEGGSREIAGITFPPHGLYFYRAYYKDYPKINTMYENNLN